MTPRTLRKHKLVQLPNENYGEFCDRMELVVKKIIEAKDVSKFTMQRMAHVLMEAPADFDYCQSFPPFSKTREFLQTQPKTVRARFKRECYKWPIYTRRRTKWLLGLPLD